MLIGITGGVGVGKSTILNIMQSSFKARLIMADNIANSLMKPGFACYDKIVEAFGTEILYDIPEKQLYGTSAVPIKTFIDKEKLRKVVLDDPEKLKQLEAIVHPEVRKAILAKLDEIYEVNDRQIVVLEAALLIEQGYDEICDDFWVVTCDKETRIERLMLSRKYTRETCEKFMKNQLTDEEYIAHADYVINNTGSIENTVAQVKSRLIEIDAL